MYVGEDFRPVQRRITNAGGVNIMKSALSIAMSTPRVLNGSSSSAILRKSLHAGIKELGITPAEAKDPKEIKYVPIGSGS